MFSAFGTMCESAKLCTDGHGSGLNGCPRSAQLITHLHHKFSGVGQTLQ